jgi:hypothetical protein
MGEPCRRDNIPWEGQKIDGANLHTATGLDQSLAKMKEVAN